MNLKALLLLVGMGAALLAAAVGSVLVARVLGPTGRGEVALIASLTGFITVFGSAGINVAFRALYPRGLAEIRSLAEVVLKNAIVAGLVAALGVALFVARGSLGHVFGLSVIAGAYTAASVLAIVSLDVMKSQGRHAYSGLADFLGALSGTLLVVAIIAFGTLTVGGALSSLALGCLVRSGFVLSGTTRSGLRESTTRAQTAALRKEGRRYLGFTIGQHLTLQSDVLVAGLFLGRSQLGIYGAASTLASMARLPALALGHVLGHEAALGRSVHTLRLQIGAGILLGVVLAGILGLVSEPLIIFVYGSEFAAATDVLLVLTLGQAIVAAYPIVSRILAGMGQPRAVTLSGYVGGAVLLISMSLLASRFGPVGAAWATVSTFTATILVLLIFARQPRKT